MEDTNFYKIGITHDITKRVKGIQTSNPLRIILLRSTSGESTKIRMLERRLHEYLAEFRKSGEWFEHPDRAAIIDVFETISIGKPDEVEIDFIALPYDFEDKWDIIVQDYLDTGLVVTAPCLPSRETQILYWHRKGHTKYDIIHYLVKGTLYDLERAYERVINNETELTNYAKLSNT